MQPKQFADLAGVSANTVRRWCRNFDDYLTPSASPDKDQTRVLTEHDVKVLHYVASLRSANQGYDRITERLRGMKEQRWEGLPELPDGWPDMSQALMPTWHMGPATVAQLSALQTELSYTQDALEQAQNRVQELEKEIEGLKSAQTTTEGDLHNAQLELANARADAARLEGELKQYSFGREKPLNVGLIVLLTAIVVAVFVIVLLVVMRLVL